MKTAPAWLVLAGFLACAPAATPAAEALRLPPHQKVTLTNGLTLLLMEQRDVPLVSLQILVTAGGVADPTGREGSALLAAELLRHGTKRRTADQIASEIDFIGGSLNIGGDADRVILGSEFMRKDTAAALDLLADLLQHPSFPAAEVTKLIKQKVDGVKQDKEEAPAVLPLYFSAALYGGHPYGRPAGGDERSLAAIRRRDVVDFYERHYGPQATIIAVAGDFSAVEMERALAERLAGWKSPAAKPSPQPAEPAPTQGRKLLLVNKPDSPQTHFALGQVGIARNNPDRTGIDLVNVLFGGRFTSMLNDALRVNSGLTYGARSRFVPHRAAGPFLISSFTATATTTQAIDMAIEVLERLHRDGVSEEQLHSAREYVKGQFPLRIEATHQLAALLADLEFYHLDESEVNDLFKKVDAFTVADARRIIHQYFPQENLVFVLIGKAGEIRPAVKKYAPQMEQREIDQPGFR